MGSILYPSPHIYMWGFNIYIYIYIIYIYIYLYIYIYIYFGSAVHPHIYGLKKIYPKIFFYPQIPQYVILWGIYIYSTCWGGSATLGYAQLPQRSNQVRGGFAPLTEQPSGYAQLPNVATRQGNPYKGYSNIYYIYIIYIRRGTLGRSVRAKFLELGPRP